MPSLCTQCGFTWSILKISEGEGEEQYEVCPLCGTDHCLQDGNGGVLYMYAELTGDIINVATGKKFEEAIEPVIAEPFYYPWEEYYAEKERREDAALNAYHKAIESGSDGKAEYFKSFQK